LLWISYLWFITNPVRQTMGNLNKIALLFNDLYRSQSEKEVQGLLWISSL